MGNQCTSANNDPYPYNTNAVIISEQYYEGQRPIIIQEHSKFNDDDQIDIVCVDNSPYGRKSLSQNYMKQARYVLADNIQLKLFYSCIPNQGTQALLLSIQTKDQPIQTPREGIDLICLIDHSGSMAGEKMRLVRSSLKHLLTLLNGNDRLCLIEFDDSNYRLTRLMRVNAENIYKFNIAIDTIEANGGTDIGNGMKMALSVLKHRKFKNPIASIFLLSDGEDEGAAGRVWKDIQQKNIKEPFTIYTFGFGKDCCPKIMSEIAHCKEGSFYYISEITRIDECFAEALGGQESVIAYNTHITVSCAKSSITKAFGDKWVCNQQFNSYSIYQPQLMYGIRKDYIVLTQVPMGTIDEVITVKVHTDSVETGERFTIEQFTNIQPNFQPDSVVFQEVMSHYYRVLAAEQFRNSLQLCYNQQYLIAQQQLLQIQQQIYSLNLNNPMITIVYTDLYQAQRYCDQMLFNQEGRHYLTQLYMIHMYQQPRGVDIVSTDPNVVIQCEYQNQLQKQYVLQLKQKKLNNPQFFQID